MPRKKYDSSSINVYDGVKAVQNRPALFVDSLDPTHILIELIDNALDEVLCDYATHVEIYINMDDFRFSVSDNGRGIPITKHKKHKDYTPNILVTQLFSGGKFNKKSYTKSSGTHGVGMCAVNALSSEFEMNIYRDGKHAKFKYENGLLKDKTISKNRKRRGSISTKIEFKPNLKYFEHKEIQLNKIEEKVNISVALISKLSIDTIIIKNGSETKKSYKNKPEKTLNEFLESVIGDSNLDKISVSDTNGNDFNVYFKISEKYNKVFGSVNLLPVHKGVHVNTVLDAAYEAICTFRKREDIFESIEFKKVFNMFLHIFISEPTFKGQYKDRLTNKKSKFNGVYKLLKKEFTKYFKSNINETKKYIKICNELKANKNNNKVKLKVEKKLKRGTYNSNTNLIDCSRNGLTSTELFIVEGNSAGGSLFKCRDSTVHAILKLQGKILNISSMDIQKNLHKELNKKRSKIKEIIDAVGIDPFTKNHKFRYEKIILLADSDCDGQHIVCLLLILFYKLCPELIDNGMLYYCEPPLYGYNKGNIFTPIYERCNIKNVNNLIRFKGLGEMNPDQLKVCAIDPTRKLIKVKLDKKMQGIIDNENIKKDMIGIE